MARIRSIHPGELPGYASRARYLYVVGEVGSATPVKVGVARHPKWRLSDLQAGNPRKMELRFAWDCGAGSTALLAEAAIQRQLSLRRVLNEWFDATADEVAALVSKLEEPA